MKTTGSMKNEFKIDDFRNGIRDDAHGEDFFDVYIRGNQAAQIIFTDEGPYENGKPMLEFGI